MDRGAVLHPALWALIARAVERRLTPLVRTRFRAPAARLCQALVRRYLPEERREHPVHYDAHAFATAVISLSPPEQFEGGLYVVSPADARRGAIVRQWARFARAGDCVAHGWDLLHGVRVLRGERYSLVCWFKTCAPSCLLGLTPWYQKSADDGDADGMYNWGAGLLASTPRRSPRRARRRSGGGEAAREAVAEAAWWLRRAAQLGHIEAQLNLGVLLWHGSEGAVERDQREAMRWWHRAAAAGKPKAQRNLAWALQACNEVVTGLEAQQRRDVARRWLHRAAAAGDSEAMYQLAHDGEGDQWLIKAARERHPRAARARGPDGRGARFARGRLRPDSRACACERAASRARLHRAIAQGATAALVTLGRLHCTTTSGALGCHAAPCLRSAARLFILAIAAGDLHADLCWRRLCALTGGVWSRARSLLGRATANGPGRRARRGRAISGATACLSMWGHDRAHNRGAPVTQRTGTRAHFAHSRAEERGAPSRLLPVPSSSSAGGWATVIPASELSSSTAQRTCRSMASECASSSRPRAFTRSRRCRSSSISAACALRRASDSRPEWERARGRERARARSSRAGTHSAVRSSPGIRSISASISFELAANEDESAATSAPSSPSPAPSRRRMLLSEKNIVRASSSTFSCKLASTSASSAGAGGASGSILIQEWCLRPRVCRSWAGSRWRRGADAVRAPRGMGPAQVLQTVFHHYAAFGRTHADTPPDNGRYRGRSDDRQLGLRENTRASRASRQRARAAVVRPPHARWLGVA